MWTFVWFLIGLLIGLAFAFPSPALQQRLAPLTSQGVTDDRKAPSAGYNKAETSSAATTSATAQQQPSSNLLNDNKPSGKETVPATTAQQGRRQRVVVESDPLHASDPLYASELITAPTKKLSKSIADRGGLGDNGRNGKNGRGSLRRRDGAGAAGGSLLASTPKGERGAHDTAVSSGTPNYHRTTPSTTPVMPTTTTPGGFPSMISTTSATPRSQVASKTRLLSSSATITGPIPATPTITTIGMDSIPMDAESRWRDHHMKRQWAQSLLIESMEPVISRHLRYAIKSVLHFTNVGPEIMDLKGSTSGLGHWDSFATPMVFPPRVVPHALSNSIQINHQASTPITATPTQASYQQFPPVTSPHATRTDHIRIPNAQQRTRSASINSLSQLLEAQRAGEAHRTKDRSTSSITSDLSTSVPLTHRIRSESTSSITSPTIVVRGFTSTAASTHTRTVTVEEAKSKSTMMVEADDMSEFELGLSESQLQYSNGPSFVGAATIATIATISTTAIDSTDNLPATLQPPNHHETESHRTGVAQNCTLASNSNASDSNGGNGFDIPTDQDLVPSKPRHSRLWSKMRKVVYGESKQQNNQSKDTIYLATGGITGTASRSMSDTHLSSPSSRPLSISSTSSFNNINMPSFSSSVLSVLSEDPISLQKKLPKTPTSSTGMSQQLPKVSVAAFETPPETAPNSPTQTLTPTSPTTRSRFGFSHNLPGLARRSSTKSPVAAAELTTVESRVSQFMYAGQTSSRPESTTSSTRSRVHSASSSGGVSVNNVAADGQRQGMPLMDLNLHGDLFSTPNALERSNLRSALKSSADIPDLDSTAKQLGRSKSASSAQRRETRHQKNSPTQAMAAGSRQQECFPDGEQFLTAHRRFREFGTLSPPQESFLKDGIPLDMTQKRDDESGVVPSSPPPSVAWNGNVRHLASSPHQQQTSALSPDGRPLSPSQMLSGSSDPLLEQAKQDRRKSAISFGGYFSNPSAAANRRTRDLTGYSISGLETDAQGEIIHLRRTSFFDKASPPTLTSLATMLHSNLPSLSQSLGGTNSPSLSRSPSKSSGFVQEQRLQLQGRPSSTNVGDTTTAGEPDTSKATTTTTTTTTTATTTPRDLKKRITPLKITPLLLSGVSSLPSPMFPPLSATIPRPLGSSTFAYAPLDRYFFNVDQVHEWNIPSFGRVKFTDHAPLVFHAIRERFHYTLADMDEALSQPMTVMKTPGKSDAIFFASHNHGRFLLKTLRGAEPDNLKGFLSDYLGHIQKYPNTLLPRYLGMYTFEKLAGSKLATGATAVGVSSTIDGSGLGATGMGFGGGDRDGSGLGGAAGGATSRNKSDATAAQHLHLNGTLLSGRDDGLPSKLVVVVLANVFDTPEVVHERYDFKGSNVGRRTLPIPVDGVAFRESRSLNPIVPEPQPRTSMDKDSGWTDFAHRHSHWRTHQLATPTTGESRASSMYYEPKSDPIYPHLHSGELGTGSGTRMTAGEGDGGSAAATDISHLTLKEVDFQNRIFTGETQLIHLGSTRKAEVLAQLEEDTLLLRKHGFMDYSMLVGIRILPKRPVQEEKEEEHQIFSSPESSRRGSLSSRGSDADNSNLDSDLEECEGQGASSTHDSLSGDSLNKKSEPKQNEIEEALGRIWKFIALSAEERLEFLKGLGEKAQGALRDVYSFGEVIVSGGQGGGSRSPTASTSASTKSTTARSTTKSGSRKDLKKDKNRAPPEVELRDVKSDRSKHHHHHHSRKHKDHEQQQQEREKLRRPLFEDNDDNDHMNPDSFQTVRYKPRTDSHSSTRPKLSVLIDSTATSRKPTLETTPRHQSMPGGIPIPPHPAAPPIGGRGVSRLYSSPYQQSTFPHHGAEVPAGNNFLHDQNHIPTIWSQGVPSLNLPDGYEAVYYFGLIDVLQKYNFVKWIERNIKGANVRLLGSGGGSGGSSSPMTPGLPSSSVPSVIHPGRSNPSTSSSFASSAFYQLLPHATASEPSLPSSAMDVTSSSTAAAATVAAAVGGTNPTLSVLLEDPSSGRGSSTSSSSSSSRFPSSRDPSSNRNSLHLDPNSSYSHSYVSTPTSSARVSQEESTLSSSPSTAPIMISDDSGKTNALFTHSPSPSFSATSQQQQQLKPRLSSSAPFTKSLVGAAARLSQYSQYSHSSQQSQHSHQSGRSRDSRLSFDARASNASESMILPHHLLSSSSSSSPPSSDSGSGGVQIHIPPGQATQATQTQTQMQQPPLQQSKLQYQAPQHAEVSVEEPGRYAERLIDFMRGVLI
ncbi:MAG: hypothetical protein J3R72DRAFT_448917 [Linnemannia gamsii]|nr:MAG: hypothetical protein J3R72DRAFT_448917 [Linnemannia gamsii]